MNACTSSLFFCLSVDSDHKTPMDKLFFAGKKNLVNCCLFHYKTSKNECRPDKNY